jgi:hypothetical protein
VIVRIATEGQYELASGEEATLNELDNQAVAACEAGDEDQFRAVFTELIEFVRKNGQKVPEEHLAPSDLIIPPPDTSLEEARAEFKGEGLIPG